MNLNHYQKSLLEGSKFLIFGQEDYFITYAIDVLKTTLNSQFAEFNYIELEHKNTTFNDFYFNLESVPMMDNRKIIHLKNFQFAQNSNPWAKEEIQQFMELIKTIEKEVVLVVSSSNIEVKDPNTKKDSYPKMLKDMSPFMNVFAWGKLTEKELEEYIKNILAEEKLEFNVDNSLIKYYIELTGYAFKDSNKNIREINTEISKIISYIKEKGSITREDIENLFLRDYEADIFKLIDFIIKRNRKEAFKMYSRLLGKGEPSMKIMVTIGSNISTMIKASYYTELGYTQAMIAQTMGKNPYAIKKGLENLKQIGRKCAIDTLEAILEVDYKFKNGLIPESVYGEITLSKIFEILEADEI